MLYPVRGKSFLKQSQKNKKENNVSKFDFDLSRYGYSANEKVAVPKADYLARLIKIETKTSKSSGVEYEMHTWRIEDGPYVGSYLFNNLNLNHDNEDTRNIARGTLRTISKCMGLEEQLQLAMDSGILKDGIVTLSVDIKEYDGALRNEIKIYKPKEKYSGNNLAPQKGLRDQRDPFVDDNVPDFI